MQPTTHGSILEPTYASRDVYYTLVNNTIPSTLYINILIAISWQKLNGLNYLIEQTLKNHLVIIQTRLLSSIKTNN